MFLFKKKHFHFVKHATCKLQIVGYTMTKIKGSLLFKMKTEIAQSTMYFYRKKSSNVLSFFKYNSLMNFPINQLLCIHCNVSCPSGI